MLPPPYVLPPFLTTKEIEIEKNKTNVDVIKTSLQMSTDERDTANEFADQKNKKIINDIIDPNPGLFINDQLKRNEQNFQKIIDNIFNPPPQIQ